MAKERHNFLVNRLHDRALDEATARFATGWLADVGCGVKPYAEMLDSRVAVHIGFDHPASLHGQLGVDIASMATALPVASASFDTVMLTAVLEHLASPAQALEEAHRVLRPGGHVIVTAPMIWHVHEAPADYYRYTRFGLEHLLTSARFELVELRALSGFSVTFGQMLVYRLHAVGGLLRRIGVLGAVEVLLQYLFLALNRFDESEDWTWANLAVARKPMPPAT